MYALLLKLDADASNSTGWDNYIYDNLMVVVSFSGVGLALIQPVIGYLLTTFDAVIGWRKADTEDGVVQETPYQ